MAIEQTLSLRKLGIDVDLLFLRSAKEVRYELPVGARILSTSSDLARRPLSLLLQSITSWFGGHRGPEATVDLDLIWRVRTLARGHDITIFNDQYAALVGAYMRVTRGKKYILVFHEFSPRVSSSYWRFLFFRVADLLDVISILVAPAIVTTSEKNLRKLNGLVPGKTVLARIGCPPPATDLSPRDKRPKTVVSLTAWDAGRHPELYIELAKRLPDYEFTLAGVWLDVNLREAVVGSAKNLGNLHITGRISEAEREQLLRRSQVYCAFGYNEAGPGMGGLEALANGCIVVANEGIGMSEIIETGKNGFVVRPFSVDSIVKTLKEIGTLSDDVLGRFSIAGQRLCLRYTWEAHALVLESEIDKLVVRPRT